jgi:Rod binding domain-containing protein
MNVAALSSSGSGDLISEQIGIKASRGQTLSGKALRNASPAEQTKEVAAQFEAILVRQLLGPTMASMLGKEGGAASNVYGDMLTNTFAEQLTRGGGFGLSRLLEQQLSPVEPRPNFNSSAETSSPL